MGSRSRTRLRLQMPRDPTAGERVAQASVSSGDPRLTLAYLRWGDRLRGRCRHKFSLSLSHGRFRDSTC